MRSGIAASRNGYRDPLGNALESGVLHAGKPFVPNRLEGKPYFGIPASTVAPRRMCALSRNQIVGMTI